ncbi:MAG: hypothetical protein J6X67_13775 [Treponema sp.]|nr:hypothetical protein [Treponema sp.]
MVKASNASKNRKKNGKHAFYHGVPGFRGPKPSIATATAPPPLHAGLTPAQEKSIHGFFLGLQNCLAILHAANPPIHGLFNFYQERNTFLASKKSLRGFFLGSQIRKANLRAAKPPSMAL